MNCESFRIVDPSLPADLHEWLALWARTSHREVQAHPGYGMAVTDPSAQLLCAVATLQGGTVLLPFSVSEVPVPIASQRPVRDARTPYGYGGAYVDGSVDAGWFWSCWDQWARANGIVGITVRSHLFEGEVLAATGPFVTPLDNVVVDLRPSLDEIWAGYEGRVRTGVRRGESLGVEVVVDEACDNLAAFHRLYLQTMDAKGANSFYSFDLGRLADLVTSLGSGVALFHAYFDGQLVSSEMQLLGASNAYYFLSGSTALGRQLSANPVMKHRVITWLKAKGLTRYILGGGMTRGDSLFRYKRAYAPRSIKEFKVTFHESEPGAAAALEEARKREEPGWHPAEDFVPGYRSPAAVGGGA